MYGCGRRRGVQRGILSLRVWQEHFGEAAGQRTTTSISITTITTITTTITTTTTTATTTTTDHWFLSTTST